MNSIKNRLVKSISIIISVILVAILLMIDLSIDGLMESQFNKTLQHEANSLITLVEEEPGGVEFMFADEFMPEFSSRIDTEYFQLWRNDLTFEKSRSLGYFPLQELPRTALPLNESLLTDITLPDGRAGRVVLIHFMPQWDSNISDVHEELTDNWLTQRPSMYLALAVSVEDLNATLRMVDIAFLLSCIGAVVVVRYLVGKIITRGLSPINELNQQLKTIDISKTAKKVKMVNPPVELLPMVNELNQFVEQNTRLYQREQRLTSDIAHELKTPISELINLTEVTIRFPNDKELSDTFHTDILAIGERMKVVVSNILLWQKSNKIQDDKQKEVLDCLQVITALIQRLSCKYPDGKTRIVFSGEQDNILINTSVFAFETIMTNLLDNALFYSTQQSQILLDIKYTASGNAKITLTNELVAPISADDIALFFEPLWQQDSARTATDHFGLGLAIVKSFCENIDGKIEVTLSENVAAKQVITFAFEL